MKKLRELNKLESELIKLEEKEIQRIIKELHKLANDSNIILRIESKRTNLSIAKYISNGKNLKINPIDSSLKNKCITSCPELPLGIISPCSYLNIKAINTLSSDNEKLSVFSEEMIYQAF